MNLERTYKAALSALCFVGGLAGVAFLAHLLLSLLFWSFPVFAGLFHVVWLLQTLAALRWEENEGWSDRRRIAIRISEPEEE